MYHAAAAGEIYPVTLLIRLRGAVPASFAGGLREIGATVDPNLQLRDIANLDERLRKEQSMTRTVAAGLALVTLSVLVLRSIFSRALGQLAIGALLGGVTASMLEVLTDGEMMGGNGAIVLPIVAVLMMIVGLLATVGPARRGLRIHPTEALREE